MSSNYLGHKLALHPQLTIKQNLLSSTNASWAQIQGALARLQLKSYAHTQVRVLSAGQQQRVALARLILNPALLWLLDEPFTNLDPEGECLLIALINEHLAQGGTTVISSHRQHDWGSLMVKTLNLDEVASC